MRFEKGNNAAAKPSKKAVAAVIRQRLEKDGDNLSPAQFTALVNRYGALTAKRRRRHRKPEGKKVSGSDADRLTGEEAEMHRTVLQIEAEQLEAGRKEWKAKQKEPTPTPVAAPIASPFTHKIWTNVLE